MRTKLGLVASTFCLLLVTVMLVVGCSTERAEVAQQIPAAQPKVEPRAAPARITPNLGAGQVTPAVSFNLAAYVPTPKAVTFCGEPVPLDEQQVYERFDKEFTIVVYNNSQVYLWLKRMQQHIPWLERRLQQLGLPDDLKYLVIEETDLLPRTWLVKTNNARYLSSGLTASHDDQVSFQQGVDGILFKLKDLRTRFPSWSLTLAAYYCGEKRLLEMMGSQKMSDPYSLQLPQVAEANMFRVLAVKTVMSNPGRYGYQLP